MVALVYDDIDTWGAWLTQIITDRFGQVIVEELSESNPKYLECALAWLYRRVERSDVQKTLHVNLQGCDVRLFHGTRLLDWEIREVYTKGLIPLKVADRKSRLCAILQNHPSWSGVSNNIDEALRLHGSSQIAGEREDGCVYASFSRAGLVSAHYLQYGAEVDGHICYHLFGDRSGEALLRKYTKPYILSFDVALNNAIQSSCMFGNFENGLREFCDMLLEPWAFKQANPEFQISTQADCPQAKIKGGVSPQALKIEKFAE
jgi:hypothetical protein